MSFWYISRFVGIYNADFARVYLCSILSKAKNVRIDCNCLLLSISIAQSYHWLSHLHFDSNLRPQWNYVTGCIEQCYFGPWPPQLVLALFRQFLLNEFHHTSQCQQYQYNFSKTKQVRKSVWNSTFFEPPPVRVCPSIRIFSWNWIIHFF